VKGHAGHGEFGVFKKVLEILRRVEDLRCVFRVGRRCRYYQFKARTGVGKENAATGGGGKYTCPLVLALASGTGMCAFLIVDTPNHAYGPGDNWGV